MKTFENKKVSIKGNESTYADLLKICLDVPPQGGFTTTEMKARLKIADSLDKAGDTIQLEDADHAKLVELVKEMKWGVVAKEIIELEEAVVNAK